MNVTQIEVLIEQFSGLLLPPILVVIIAPLCFYTLLMLSGILNQYLQRRRNNRHYIRAVRSLAGEGLAMRLRPVRGYPLFSHYQDNPHQTAKELEIFALKELERQHIVACVAVMVGLAGLVASMVALSPVLMSFVSGHYQDFSENLIVAFVAVIFGFFTVAITLWIANVKKHWFAGELNDLRACLTRQEKQAWCKQ